MLVEAYGDSALSEQTCRDWFHLLKDYNFDLNDKKRENRPRKVEDHQLQALLDEDDTQSQKILAEQLGVTQPCNFHTSTCHEKGFLHDNAPSHTSKMVRIYLETLNWEVLPHAAYSPDLAPFRLPPVFVDGPRAR